MVIVRFTVGSGSLPLGWWVCGVNNSETFMEIGPGGVD